MNRKDLRQARGVLPYPSKDPVMANPTATGVYAFLTLRPDADEPAIRDFLQAVQGATDELRTAVDADQRRVATVATGFSSTFFAGPAGQRFPNLSAAPAGFGRLPVVDASTGSPSSTPVAADVLCYLVSTSEGVTARFLGQVAGHPAVAGLMLERGYQRLDGSEPFGYRDGVRNSLPKSERGQVVFIDVDELPEEPWWAHGGTYLAYLKVEQHPAALAQLTPDEQDATIGRTRLGHRLDEPDKSGKLEPAKEGPFSGEVPPVDSHVRKVGPRDGGHDQVRIFRRGLPYYETDTAGVMHVGLHFVSFQSSLVAFDVVFNRWMTNPAFPPGGPGQPDRLLTRGLITVSRHGFYFVPPNTDTFIGEAMFTAGLNAKKPKTGQVAVRKQLRDAATGGPHRGELAGFTFRVVDGATPFEPSAPSATAVPGGEDFATDSRGHAQSGDLPADTPLRLLEVSGPTGVTLAPPQDFTLQSARKVIPVENTVPAGTTY